MKKVLAGILTLVLLSTMLSAALAAPFALNEEGATIELPEGMTGTNELSEDGFMVSIAVDGNEFLLYTCFVGYEEGFAGRLIDELTEEEEAMLMESIAVSMEEAIYEIIEVDEFPILAAENGDFTQVYFVALSGGWAYTVATAKTDGVPLTDEEVEAALEMLFSIDLGTVAE